MILPNIPTAITEPEALALNNHAKDNAVLEIGSLLGFSTIVMAQVSDEVWSFDPHRGYPVNKPKDTWEPFLKNLYLYNHLINTILSP